jgi:hypothetical protein
MKEQPYLFTKKEVITEEERLDQGVKASEVFSGQFKSETVKKLYSESAQTFAEIIKAQILKDKKYIFADFGSHKGDLQKNILSLLPGYNFHTIGVDVEKNLKDNDVADNKVVSKLTDLPFGEGAIDFAIARYILVWNSPENQQKILKEITRTVRDFVILQHAGADIENSSEWRLRLDDLFDGEEVPSCKRTGHYFSSRDEVEQWMKETGINFERINERKVEAVSNVFIERTPLNEMDAETTRKILGDKDYIIQTTWIIKSNKEGK